MIIVLLDRTYRSQILRLITSLVSSNGFPSMTPDERRAYLDRLESDVDYNLQHCTYVGLVEEDQLLGFCSYSSKGHINQLFVHPASHGVGFGGRLLDHVVEKSRGDRYTVNAAKNAVAFYQKHGFKIVGVALRHYGLEYIPMQRTGLN